MIIGRNFIEKLYSENYSEYEDTKLYSTGDEMLDNLLERAFCEGYELGQKEFGRTGLTKQQASQFFTPTNKAQSKEIKNRALNIQMNNGFAGPNSNTGPNRRVAQGWGNASNDSYLKGSSYGGKIYIDDGYRGNTRASSVDLSINKKAGLATAGANTGNHASIISQSANNSMRYGNPLVRQNQGGTKAIIKQSRGLV